MTPFFLFLLRNRSSFRKDSGSERVLNKRSSSFPTSRDARAVCSRPEKSFNKALHGGSGPLRRRPMEPTVSQNGDGPRAAARITGRATRDSHRPARHDEHSPRTARTATHMPYTAQHHAHQHTLMHTARHMQHAEQAAAPRRMQHRTARPSAARAAHTRAPARGAARREQRPASPTRAAILFFPSRHDHESPPRIPHTDFFFFSVFFKKRKKEREKKKKSRDCSIYAMIWVVSVVKCM